MAKRNRRSNGSAPAADPGYARGGAVVGSTPGGFGSFSSVLSDPVARRRYTPRHTGFASGGEVDDPMDYVPDSTQEQSPPQSNHDELNMIGREGPMVNPMLAGITGYAGGGAVSGRGLTTASGARVGEVPAYSTNTPSDSPANAKLFADMDALRERTVHPPPLQMPELPPLPSTGGMAPQFQSAQGSGQGVSPYPTTGTVVNPPPYPTTGTSVNPPSGNTSLNDTQRLFDKYVRYAPSHFAAGGAVDQPVQPDIEGYVRGAHALPPEQLDAHIQQTAAANPGLDANDLHMKAVADPARAGNHRLASAVMAGLRRRHDSLNAHAQGAAAHGDLAVAAQLADRAHEHVPDGHKVRHFVDGGGVTVDVQPGGRHRLTPQQFHDHLVGPGTSFDHLLEKGINHNLAKISQVHPPSRTGYVEGGEVEDYRDHVHKVGDVRTLPILPGPQAGRPTQSEMARSYGGQSIGPSSDPGGWTRRENADKNFVIGPRGYQEGGTVDNDEAARRTADEAARVKEVLEHTRQSYNLIEPTGGETALARGIGFPASWGPQPPTRSEAEVESAMPAVQTQEPKTASSGAEDWERRKEQVKQGMQDFPARVGGAIREALRDEPGTARRGGSTAAPLRDQPAPEDVSGVTADEAQRTAGPREQREPQQADKPTITEAEWQDYLAQQKPAVSAETTGGGGAQTGYYRPTDDPNDPFSRPAGVMQQAETAPVNRNITTPSGPYKTRDVPMPGTPGRSGTYPIVLPRRGVVDVPYQEAPTPAGGFVGGAYRPTYTGPQGEERTGPNTAVASYTRGPNGEIRPTQATIDAAQARGGGRAPADYPESRGAFPPELQPRDSRWAGQTPAERERARTAAPTGAPVNPAYSQEPFAGDVQETGQPVPTTSQRDQEAAQRSAQRVAVPYWAPQGSTVEQIQDGRAVGRSPDGKIISINGDRVVRDKAGTILNPSGGEPPRPQPQQQAQQPQQPQVPKPPSAFYNLGTEPGIPAPKYERTKTGQHLINGAEIQQAQHQWTAWNHDRQTIQMKDAEWHTKQQQAIADMTPAQLIANHGHLLRTLPTLSEEDQRSARPILDSLREQMTRRRIAPPPLPAPAQPKSGGSMLNPANWFGGGGGGNAPAPRMGRLPDGTMVQID